MRKNGSPVIVLDSPGGEKLCHGTIVGTKEVNGRRYYQVKKVDPHPGKRDTEFVSDNRLKKFKVAK